MRCLRDYWLQFALTACAAAYAYRLDAQDGAISLPLLLSGTLIATGGFFGGSFLINRLRVKHD